MRLLKFSRMFVIVPLVLALHSLHPFANAQEKNAAEAAPPSLPSTRSLPPDYPVITVHNECPKAGTGKVAARHDCNIVVSRKEFEELINAINPKMPKYERRELAKDYAHMLALSEEASRRGLDKTPNGRALMRYVRTNALGSTLYKQLLRAASDASPAEMEKYLAANKPQFDRYTFQRIFIPIEKQGQATSLEQVARGSSTEPDMTKLAETIHARAVAGEDFAALQKEVATQAGLTQEVNVTLEDMVRGTLSPSHQQIFDLAPGAVSPLLTDASGHYIYKLVLRQSPPFDKIQSQVAVVMQNERLRTSLNKVQDRSTVDAAYFDNYDPPPPNPNEPEADDD